MCGCTKGLSTPHDGNGVGEYARDGEIANNHYGGQGSIQNSDAESVSKNHDESEILDADDNAEARGAGANSSFSCVRACLSVCLPIRYSFCICLRDLRGLREVRGVSSAAYLPACLPACLAFHNTRMLAIHLTHRA